MAVAPLENVPDSEKDWHPNSGGLVLDLVHPSLYPIVYGRTIDRSSDSPTIAFFAPPEYRDVDAEFVSERFQWLPSDFIVNDDGKVTLTSPYINNVHPTYNKELYSVIPKILEHAVPMYERVLSDLLRPILPMRIVTSVRRGWGGVETADCIWENGIPYSSVGYYGNEDAWVEKQELRTPDGRETYDGDLKAMNNRLSLKGRPLQVIVKLANIILTPEKPEYPGGKWHVEGLLR